MRNNYKNKYSVVFNQNNNSRIDKEIHYTNNMDISKNKIPENKKYNFNRNTENNDNFKQKEKDKKHLIVMDNKSSRDYFTNMDFNKKKPLYSKRVIDTSMDNNLIPPVKTSSLNSTTINSYNNNNKNYFKNKQNNGNNYLNSNKGSMNININSENQVSFNFKDKKNITNNSNIIVNENEDKKIIIKNEKMNYVKKIVQPNKKNSYNESNIKKDGATKIFNNLIKNKNIKNEKTNTENNFIFSKKTPRIIPNFEKKIEKTVENSENNSNNLNQNKNISIKVNTKDQIPETNLNQRESFKYLVHKANEVKELAESFNKYYLSENGPNKRKYKKSTYDANVDEYYDNNEIKEKDNDNYNDNDNNKDIIDIYLTDNNKSKNNKLRVNSSVDELIANQKSKINMYQSYSNNLQNYFSSRYMKKNNEDSESKDIMANTRLTNFLSNRYMKDSNNSQNSININKDLIDQKYYINNNINYGRTSFNFYKIMKYNNYQNNTSLPNNEINNTEKSNPANNSSLIPNDKNIRHSLSSLEEHLNKKKLNNDNHENLELDLDNLLNLESKIKNILYKLSNCERCFNEYFELIDYYYSINFYYKELNLFKTIKNKKNISEMMKKEIINYFLCYDLSFDNKNFTKVSVLLKAIMNLLYTNFLLLVDFIINNIPKYANFTSCNIITNDSVIYNKLKKIIISHLKAFKVTKNESDLILIMATNFKEVLKYYQMIIDNFYSHNKYINDTINYHFPNCLKIEFNKKNKIYIICSFFNESISNKNINGFTFDDLFNFYHIYLYNNESDIKSKCIVNKKINEPQKFYLPPMKKNYKYTLVLDLDETLIYCRKDMLKNNPKNFFKSNNSKILIMRPGLIEFLRNMKQYYELVLFSFGTSEYVDTIVSIIEKNEKFFEHILYRDHATFSNNIYIKNLSLLGRDLKNILIVDDIPQMFKSHKNNGICIRPFYGDVVSDKYTLKLLGEILKNIRYDADKCGDIRKSLNKYKNFIFMNITNNFDK